MENEDPNYARLMAAQNESDRRQKIYDIQKALTEEQKKKRGYAIASGVFSWEFS